MSCLLLMVDADNQDSHDDAFADDKSQRFESIDSLKQRDAGQMLILKRLRLPLLDYKQQMDERHVVKKKASVAAVAEQPMREIANTFVDYKRQDAVASDKSDEDTHCSAAAAAVSFHELVIFPIFELPFLNDCDGGDDDDSRVCCVNLRELLSFLRWVYEVVLTMATLSIGVLV